MVQEGENIPGEQQLAPYFRGYGRWSSQRCGSFTTFFQKITLYFQVGFWFLFFFLLFCLKTLFLFSAKCADAPPRPESKHGCLYQGQWRSMGASGGTRPRAQALGAQQHTFCSHFKRVFKQKFRPNYAQKCVVFEKKL